MCNEQSFTFQRYLQDQNLAICRIITSSTLFWWPSCVCYSTETGNSYEIVPMSITWAESVNSNIQLLISFEVKQNNQLVEKSKKRVTRSACLHCHYDLRWRFWGCRFGWTSIFLGITITRAYKVSHSAYKYRTHPKDGEITNKPLGKVRTKWCRNEFLLHL